LPWSQKAIHQSDTRKSNRKKRHDLLVKPSASRSAFIKKAAWCADQTKQQVAQQVVRPAVNLLPAGEPEALN
jgi:hypothetical protein